MHIRPAQTADAEQLLAIYAYYVKNTAISFEYAVPSLEAFQNRIRTTLKQSLSCFGKRKCGLRICLCGSFCRTGSLCVVLQNKHLS